MIGFDLEQHVYGENRYPAQLVLQDVRTIHGSQFKDATIIVASSPCQEFSYRAMPWKRAKALGPPHLGMELFAQAGRIQKEASEAAGRYIPMIQENVRGAQPWVGKAQWHYGSYYLWGDVPALMPIAMKAIKVGGFTWSDFGKEDYVPQGFNRTAEKMLGDGVKAGDRNKGRVAGAHQWTTSFKEAGQKNTGGSWFGVAHNTTSGHGRNPDGRNDPRDGVKQGGDWFNAASLDGDGLQSISRRSGSRSSARKAASAQIAKIPFPLASFIAMIYDPRKGVVNASDDSSTGRQIRAAGDR